MDHLTEVADSAVTRQYSQSRDAQILERAVRESIETSPGSFLKTIADVDAVSPKHWDEEIRTSTWVVAQQRGKVIGIAVARRPDPVMDQGIKPDKARFIESLWIAPKYRGIRMGERLTNYLMKVECGKFPGIGQFVLWVFESNKSAIALYKRMNFKYVEKRALVDDRIELRYEYDHLSAIRQASTRPVLDATPAS